MAASDDKRVQDWLARVGDLRQYAKGGQRSPNKPLLLLYALGRLHNDGNSRVPYEHNEARLKEMLNDFGPPRQSGHSPEYAFSRMGGDKIWRLQTADGSTPAVDSRTALVRTAAVGSLPDDDEQLLKAHPDLFSQTVQQLLRGNWPESFHAEICQRVGLNLELLHSQKAEPANSVGSVQQTRQQRDPEFRPRVLRAYEHQCAMCGWDARLSQASVGLEAAHIQWKAYEGPDNPNNGISLCVLHHQLFDRGVLGISADLRVEVSQDFNGRGRSAQLVIELANQQLIPPQSAEQRPHEQYLDWHRTQVFKSPARLPL